MTSVIAMPTASQPRGAEPDSDSVPPQTDDARATAAPASHHGRNPRLPQLAQAAAPRAHGPVVPLPLSGLAMAGWPGFQPAQLLAERKGLVDAHLSQQQSVDSAARLRASLDALAADPQRMAQAGNRSAKLPIDEQGQRGVTINATAAATTPVAPATPASTAR